MPISLLVDLFEGQIRPEVEEMPTVLSAARRPDLAANYRSAGLTDPHRPTGLKLDCGVLIHKGLKSQSFRLSHSGTRCFRTRAREVLAITKAGPSSSHQCICYDLHASLVPYSTAWEWQKALVSERHLARLKDEESPDAVIILQHPPVYTLGTRSSLSNLKFDANHPPYELHITERGGEVTYHGPGQLVIYPILDLRKQQTDLHWYLRSLEEVAILALKDVCGINAGREPGLTGVWVGNSKLAAIGVRVSKWVTYHGLALNVCNDLAPFDDIIPCGISDKNVGSVRKLLQLEEANKRGNKRLPTSDVELLKDLSRSFKTHLAEVFGLIIVDKRMEDAFDHLRSVVVQRTDDINSPS